MDPMSNPLLQVRGLSISRNASKKAHEVSLVRDIQFSIQAGEALGLVGESGSGKSLTAFSLMGLLPNGIERSHGQALFKGEDLFQLSEKKFRKLRGAKVAMILQDSLNALNPMQRVSAHMIEVLRIHRRDLTKQSMDQLGFSFLEKVGIRDVERCWNSYPHELSGGMIQRVIVAMALLCGPELLIADEPTTALDVGLQLQLVQLLKRLQKETGVGLLFISHDLALVSLIADRIAVMRSGRIVEQGKTDEVLHHPRHPYTKALLLSRPHPALHKRFSFLPQIERLSGAVKEKSGCDFFGFCPQRKEDCLSSNLTWCGDEQSGVLCLHEISSEKGLN